MSNIITLDSAKILCQTYNKIYDVQVRLFNAWLEGRAINIDIIKEYLDKIKNEKSIATFNQVKVALKKAILNTFRKESYNILFVTAINDTFKALRTAKTDKKVLSKDVLTKQEIDKMINESNEKDSLVIKTLAQTGLRVSEMINIKLSDCRAINNIVHIKIIGKGRKERTIRITKNLYESIINAFKGNTYLFENKNTDKNYTRTTIFRLIKKAGKIINRSDLHPHLLRHFFATHHILKGDTVKAVSNYLGHSSTSITNDMYVHDELSDSQLFENELF